MTNTQERRSRAAGAEGEPLVGGAPIPFRPRRTYLDACREQGVHNSRLENEDELARLQRGEQQRDPRAEQLVVDRAVNPPVALALHNERTGPFADALRERDGEIVQRFQIICRSYQEAGFGDAHFPMLMTLLFDVAFKPEDARNLFHACRSDMERHHRYGDEPEQRFNATGLICGSYGRTFHQQPTEEHDA